MMLGLLLARRRLPTTVLEQHGDFLRDFRGDTVHPSTLSWNWHHRCGRTCRSSSGWRTCTPSLSGSTGSSAGTGPDSCALGTQLTRCHPSVVSGSTSPSRTPSAQPGSSAGRCTPGRLTPAHTGETPLAHHRHPADPARRPAIPGRSRAGRHATHPGAAARPAARPLSGAARCHGEDDRPRPATRARVLAGSHARRWTDEGLNTALGCDTPCHRH